MKTTISILFSLICYFSVAQPIQNRSGDLVTVQDARWKALKNAFMPTYNDTAQANSGTNEGIDSSGAIIYTRNPYAIWYRRNRHKNHDLLNCPKQSHIAIVIVVLWNTWC